MASAFTLKPMHKAVKNYYAARAGYADQTASGARLVKLKQCMEDRHRPANGGTIVV